MTRRFGRSKKPTPEREWPGADLIGRQMQAEAQGAAAGAIEGATSGALLYTTMAVPLTGEALDIMVLANSERSTGQQLVAGVSLALFPIHVRHRAE